MENGHHVEATFIRGEHAEGEAQWDPVESWRPTVVTFSSTSGDEDSNVSMRREVSLSWTRFGELPRLLAVLCNHFVVETFQNTYSLYDIILALHFCPGGLTHFEPQIPIAKQRC